MAPYRRILIADDIVPVQRSMVRLARAALDAESLETAADGAEVLTRLLEARARGEPFDLLISDIGMPRWSGARLLIRMREETLDVPTLFCTGRSTCPGIEQLRSLGFTVLGKPFGSHVLQDALRMRPRSPMDLASQVDLEAAVCTQGSFVASACSEYCGAGQRADHEDVQRLSMLREGRRRLHQLRDKLPPSPVR